MSVAKLSLAKIFQKTLDSSHFIVYNTHMSNDDLDHLCKMLQNSHDTASKVTGMDDTMFLQALDGIKWLRDRIQRMRDGMEGCCTACEPVGVKNQELETKLKACQRELSNLAMDRLAQFDEENGL